MDIYILVNIVVGCAMDLSLKENDETRVGWHVSKREAVSLVGSGRPQCFYGGT
jgi:hypothetical protein